jgi:hypothetical protein
VRLRREKVALSPVYYTALQVDAAAPAPGLFVAAAPPLAAGDADAGAPGSGSPSWSAALGGLLEGSSSTAPGRTQLNTAVPSLLARPAAAASMPAAAAPASKQQQQQQQQGDRWGYLRLTAFSQNAADEMKKAIVSLEVTRALGVRCVCA